MSKSNFLRRWLSALTVAGSALVAAVPAQAAVVAIFDPAFGLDRIPNLGFQGQVTLDVSQACYDDAAASSDSYAFTDGVCTITPIAGTLTFYNVTNDPGATNPFSPSIDLLPYLQDFWVTGAFFDPETNVFAGFDTLDSLQFPVLINDTSSNPISYDGNMLLYFESGHEPILTDRVAARSSSDPAFLVDCNQADQQEVQCTRNTGSVSDPADVTFITIPEPDSIALSMLGLGALVAARRRKSIAR